MRSKVKIPLVDHGRENAERTQPSQARSQQHGYRSDWSKQVRSFQYPKHQPPTSPTPTAPCRTPPQRIFSAARGTAIAKPKTVANNQSRAALGPEILVEPSDARGGVRSAQLPHSDACHRRKSYNGMASGSQWNQQPNQSGRWPRYPGGVPPRGRAATTANKTCRQRTTIMKTLRGDVPPQAQQTTSQNRASVATGLTVQAAHNQTPSPPRTPVPPPSRPCCQ